MYERIKYSVYTGINAHLVVFFLENNKDVCLQDQTLIGLAPDFAFFYFEHCPCTCPQPANFGPEVIYGTPWSRSAMTQLLEFHTSDSSAVHLCSLVMASAQAFAVMPGQVTMASSSVFDLKGKLGNTPSC